jgi:dihydroorotate dehydrogenase electron transfer subunit
MSPTLGRPALDSVATSLPQVARITHLVDESPTVRTITLNLRVDAEPGQFLMAWLPGIDERPFSLASPDPVTLTIARVGPFTEAVHALQPGDRLWLRGPLGRGFSLPQPPPSSALLLLAGGYGVAPLHFLAQRAVAEGWPVTAVIGARTGAEVVFVSRFQALGARVEAATDDGSLGWRGFVTEPAAALLDAERPAAIYACGPEPMLVAVEELARRHRRAAQLCYERKMRCGFGVCGTCHRDGWLVCRDGPVRIFDPFDTWEED